MTAKIVMAHCAAEENRTLLTHRRSVAQNDAAAAVFKYKMDAETVRCLAGLTDQQLAHCAEIAFPLFGLTLDARALESLAELPRSMVTTDPATLETEVVLAHRWLACAGEADDVKARMFYGLSSQTVAVLKRFTYLQLRRVSASGLVCTTLAVRIGYFQACMRSPSASLVDRLAWALASSGARDEPARASTALHPAPRMPARPPLPIRPLFNASSAGRETRAT